MPQGNAFLLLGKDGERKTSYPLLKTDYGWTAEAEIAEREQQAQEEYQRQTEREQTQSEMDEIAPVVRDIRKKRIWLNEQQIAEVLHTTGLRTIAQVNRQYGTQFRVNRKSAGVDLDSGFFRELAAQIPDGWTRRARTRRRKF